MTFRFGRLILRNILFRDLEYRAHYYLLTISSFITFAADYLILKYSSAASRVTYIGPERIFSFVALGILLRTSVVMWDMSLAFEQEIRSGEFRRYLLQPIRFPELYTYTAIGEKLVTWFFLGLAAVLTLWLQQEPRLIMPAPSFFIFLPLAVLITWSIYYCFLTLTFWLQETSFLTVAFNISMGIFAGSIVPLDWLPPTLQKIIYFTPLPFLGDIPIRAAFGNLSADRVHFYLGAGLVWLGILSILNFVLFRKGVRRYESFGG